MSVLGSSMCLAKIAELGNRQTESAGGTMTNIDLPDNKPPKQHAPKHESGFLSRAFEAVCIVTGATVLATAYTFGSLEL